MCTVRNSTTKLHRIVALEYLQEIRTDTCIYSFDLVAEKAIQNNQVKLLCDFIIQTDYVNKAIEPDIVVIGS